MGNIIFKDITNDSLHDVVNGFIHAFPHLKYADAKEIVLEQLNDKEMEYIAAYTGDRYAGIAVIADIFLNFRGHVIKAIDLDHLHTDILAKKQGVSSVLIREASRRCLDKGIPIMFVGPFSTKFYRDKGFGFGLRKLSFDSDPIDFKNYNTVDGIEYYNPDNNKQKHQLHEFIYSTRLFCAGNITLKPNSYFSFIDKLSQKDRVTIIYRNDNEIHGYLTYVNSNDIVVEDILYDTTSALKALSTFLYRQNGQAKKIRVKYCDEPTIMNCDRPKNITHEEYSMVKILDVERFFKLMQKRSVNFNNQTLSLQIVTHDRLTDETCDTTICFKDGLVMGINDSKADAKISLDIAEFSSLVIGRYSFYDLINSGLAEIDSIDYIDRISKIFYTNYIPLIRN